MNVVIIEDEKIQAEELVDCIESLRGNWKVVTILKSVKEAIDYFNGPADYQLIFSDIQLGDGLSFTIFKQVQTHAPVIFCTAYNEYAIEAFKNNGIDYILKPFNRKVIEEAVTRYETLKATISNNQPDYHKLIQLLQPAKTIPSSLLVNHRDKIIPVKTCDIALFYIHNGLVYLIDFQKNTFIISQTMDELETTLGDAFYRTDRQHLVNRKAIQDVSQYFARKLLLNLTVEYAEQVTIRKEKTGEFLEWLAKN